MQLFEAKKRLYPQKVKGKIRNIKSILNIVFLTIFFLSPFLRFERGNGAPNQAILIDLPNSKAYFFAIEIWPQEVFYLAGILITAAIMLFFITSLFGRIWCGYACFQTVWTDIFIGLERFFQGDRNDRIILDRKNNFKKFYKKSLTHISWILVSFATGFGFVCYFNDAIELLKNFSSLYSNITIIGWILGIGAMTYVMAGFAREHVCTFMCPYSRFQSAMFDENTLIITYDEKRGEPRGKFKQGENFDNRGDCIDCKQCVVVCPTGIDIRKGLQMECIACGLCVDACDNVMEKINRPKGLIRYDTEKHLSQPIPQNKFKPFRLRTFFYALILTLTCGFMAFKLMNKSLLEVDAIPDRNPIFVTLSDGSIRNGYSIKIMNKTHENKKFSLSVESPQETEIKMQSYEDVNLENLPVNADSLKTFKIYAILPKSFLEKNSEGRNFINLKIKDNSTSEEKTVQMVFISK